MEIEEENRTTNNPIILQINEKPIEIENEIGDIIFDFLKENISFKTGITITTNKSIFKSKN